MPNGWINDEANVAAASNLSLGACRFMARATTLHGVHPQDKGQSDLHVHGLLRTKPETDQVAFGLAYALVLSNAILSVPSPWEERMEKEPLMFVASARGALLGLRESLSDPVLAEHFKTDSKSRRSVEMAAEMDIPDTLYETVTELNAWTGLLATRTQSPIFPIRPSSFSAAIEAAGGLPCAVYNEGYIGFPTIVTAYDPETGRARGFPTAGFVASEFWSKRSSWLQDNVISGVDLPQWSGLPSHPHVIEAAIDHFHTTALPAMRQANAAGMFLGTKAIAVQLGVSVPRLAGWMRQEGYLVRGSDGWVPAPSLGDDTVLRKLDKMNHVYYVWSPGFVAAVSQHVEDISRTVLTRGPAKPPIPATDKQMQFLRKLLSEAGESMPEAEFLSKKAASDAIAAMQGASASPIHGM